MGNSRWGKFFFISTLSIIWHTIWYEGNNTNKGDKMTWKNSMKIDYDSWLMRGSGVDDVEDYEVGDAVLSMRLRGGVVKVSGSVTREYGRDEDGWSSYLDVKIKYAHWSFGDWADVDLSEDEREEVEKRIKQETKH
jgi:hypothetical protein